MKALLRIILACFSGELLAKVVIIDTGIEKYFDWKLWILFGVTIGILWSQPCRESPKNTPDK